jgi:hypothetical protein
MRRREFITLLGSVTWAVTARAQQPEGMRRIAVLMAHPYAPLAPFTPATTPQQPV